MYKLEVIEHTKNDIEETNVINALFGQKYRVTYSKPNLENDIKNNDHNIEKFSRKISVCLCNTITLQDVMIVLSKSVSDIV